MTRNLKTLGLALLAVFALGAMAAQAASAADIFTATNSPATVTGLSSNNVFQLTESAVRVECAKAHFSGTLTTGTASLTVTPTYTGTAAEPTSTHCGTNGLGKATVDMNGCDYELTGITTQSDVTSADAVVWIKCTGSNEIVVTNSLCNLMIPAQTPTTGGVTYASNAGKVTITATATGITYTSEGAFCGLGGIPSEGDDADINGTVLVEATSGGTISYSGS